MPTVRVPRVIGTTADKGAVTTGLSIFDLVEFALDSLGSDNEGTDIVLLSDSEGENMGGIVGE